MVDYFHKEFGNLKEFTSKTKYLQNNQMTNFEEISKKDCQKNAINRMYYKGK